MPYRWNPREHTVQLTYVFKWLLLTTPVAALIGSACALFLWSLELATTTREQHPWLLFLLPAAGALLGWVYLKAGKGVEAGNNLILDQIHKPEDGVPGRMAPLILISTVLTHLFGGSAGREGTAVQMGGSLASKAGRLLRLNPSDTRILLMTGIAAGFGGVFGTPLAGAIFAMEVLTIGRISYEALVPCLIAALVGDWACTAWGIRHTQYHIALGDTHLSFPLLLKVALAAIIFGLASTLFAKLTHGMGTLFKRAIPSPILRPAVGGLLVIGLVYLVGTRDYLGLGVHSSDPNAVTILSCFQPDGAGAFSWWWKILFTALTLGCGFKGGEVTPLFFIGAALGNALAHAMGAPVDLFAGLGFVAVFAGASNTPLACTIMSIELFGGQHAVYMALACFLAYLLSGHSGIYLSQRIATPKIESIEIPPETPLRLVNQLKQSLRSSVKFRLANDNPGEEKLPTTKGS